MSPWSFLVIFLLPASAVLGLWLGGPFTFLPVALTFVLVPLADALIGRDTRNPTEEEARALSERRSFRYITWAAVPVQYAVIGMGLWAVAGDGLSGVEWIGLAVGVGVVSGAMGINVAHELVHRREAWERGLGYALLATVGYMHWGIEHVWGHHRHVATPGDPATSRLGESFYAFWPRTVIGTWRSAWRIEVANLAKRGRGPWTWRNRMIGFTALPVLLVGAVWAALGPAAAGFAVVQAVVAFSLLEVVNYLEHYGLERRPLPDGGYEKVTPLHSWNASERLTNRFLFHLQRHSDHHAYASRRYQALRHFDESPQLPTGYAGMVPLALVPPLWRRVMDPRVAGFRARLAAAAPAAGATADE